MKTSRNPILDEVRAIRDQHAAQFGYAVRKLFNDIRARQQQSNRKYVRYPPRPAAHAVVPANTE